jgi:hydrogenase maturation protein HypF
VHALVEGTVQGVGFRPFVHRLAGELGVGGSVRNDDRGVRLELEGDPAAVGRLLDRLVAEAPPLAAVERVSSCEVAPLGERAFEILGSDASGHRSAPVAGEAATCADCRAELFDPADRRYRYPFINCTNCGPRFTIVRGTPYDRHRTTMAEFAMCPRCRAEYRDPADRRFHAQPNACPDCGPRARLLNGAGKQVPDGADAVAAAAAALRQGAIVAVKGLGGYHLACRADHEPAVAKLRARKRREEKPFALMAADLDEARRLAELGPEQETLLAGRVRPIVLARRRPDARVAAMVAPGSRDLGLMLPYSPLHLLLLADAGTALVMTSGNASDEPIAFRDRDALEQLRGIADLFLVHDRPIETRVDDSVVQLARLPQRRSGRAARALLLRRSRGYVPESLELPVACEHPVIACGAELKSTFCVAQGHRAWVGPHIGDLRTVEALASFREGIAHFERLFAVSPRLCAHDLHPDYLSTGYALEREGVELVGVQHHHAHLAACLAEHGLRGPAVGAIYDGTGYGADGTIWGGELLVGDLAGFERVGRLWSVRMPGGEAAIREPWRMACAWLVEALASEPAIPRRLRGRVTPRSWLASCELARNGLASPSTTSVGRLFDAVAALCGLRTTVSYEGQAAFELQAACDEGERGAYAIPAVDAPERPAAAADLPRGGPEPGTLAEPARVLDARPAVAAIAGDLDAGASVPRVAARFHNGLARATADACAEHARRHRLELVVLSGGVFQNRLLLERTAAALSEAGLRVVVPMRLPANDGGISYGQAAVAAARQHLVPARRA